MKSFKPKDKDTRKDEGDDGSFQGHQGQKRSNETH